MTKKPKQDEPEAQVRKPAVRHPKPAPAAPTHAHGVLYRETKDGSEMPAEVIAVRGNNVLDLRVADRHGNKRDVLAVRFLDDVGDGLSSWSYPPVAE